MERLLDYVDAVLDTYFWYGMLTILTLSILTTVISLTVIELRERKALRLDRVRAAKKESVPNVPMWKL